jgi:hypothetical protein
MAEVFVCPAGTVSKRSVADLRKVGVVVVESEAPERCLFIRSSETIKSDDMLWAVLSALNDKGEGWSSSNGQAQRNALAKRLFEIVDEARQARKKTTEAVDG